MISIRSICLFTKYSAISETIVLAPSPVGLSAAQLQRKPSESPEEHIARITALLNTVAEAMAIAVIEQKRKLRDRKVNNPKMKL